MAVDGAIVKHLSRDPVLKQILEQRGMPAYWKREEEQDLYVALIRSIVSQQLSVKAAATIFDRFLRLFPDGYPTQSIVLAEKEEVLRSAGLSRQKSRYVRAVAEFFADPENASLPWDQMSDEEVLQKLISIKGVGLWTGQMILMFSLNRPDVFPVDDLGIRQTIQELYGLEVEGKKALSEEISTIADAWKPYRTYACKLLWNYKDG